MTEEINNTEQSSNLIDAVIELLNHHEYSELPGILGSLEAAEIAHLIESIPDSMRAGLWQEVAESAQGEVLGQLGDMARNSLVEHVDEVNIVAAATTLPTRDLAEVIENLPDDLGEAIRESLDYQGLNRLEATLAFAEDSTGRLMETDAVSVRADVSLDTVLRYLRRRESLPDQTVGLMVVDREGHFLGELPFSALLTRQPELEVAEVMNTEAVWVKPDFPQKELAMLFRDHNLVSVAVADEDGKLIGRVTSDDMMDVVQEEADRQILGAAGLDEHEDLFAPVLPSAHRRALWLGINLATAFLAAWVIGLFEEILDKVVALAVLMPIVASMGGIAGSQTLTLIIRGLAVGNISSSNTRWLAYKEIAISLLNGIVWATVVGGISYLWFGDVRISSVLGVAMIINMFFAAFSGVALPLLMNKMGIDPALAGSVVLTTVTDVIGFMSFLGLATLFLL